jgi:hypothetical protein
MPKEEIYQKLKSKLKELRPVAEKVEGLLEEYKRTADDQKQKDFKKKHALVFYGQH